jgi:GntR family transcriptional regulator/MocR family aminotransferase
LRLGYLVLPPPLVDAFAAARSIGDRYPPVFNQAVVCDFIVEGHFGRHLRRMREVYAERRDVFVKAMASRLGGLVTLGETRAGMQTVGWLPPELPDEKVAASAAERGLEVLPLSRLASGSGKLNGLFLGFAAVEPRTIRRGVEELAAVIDECHARR